MGKQLLFSVGMKDFEMQTFTVGGHGGGGKDTSNSGVRLIHKDSGAVGEGRDHRGNTQNRKDAFLRLIKTPKFKAWHKLECARRMGKPVLETPEQTMARVDRMIEEGLKRGEIRVENMIVATKDDPDPTGIFSLTEWDLAVAARISAALKGTPKKDTNE